ncbi:MAG TPA: DegT/DnrJ/EryC1/StrS family aminotransferase [Solirubrobacteraceae bacterium]|jgi:aminotransferase|nr:DegT/DnrJ/EryC1/StrS family aminotransferase [Solirubrobacteraceae bacterium]
MISLFQPSVGSAELHMVRDVFEARWLGAGARVELFEQRLSAYIGRPANEVLTVSSCTEGLFQTSAALGLGAGDDVVMPTISFVGAAHAIRSSGARVALCDVDPRTLNPTVEHIEDAITPTTKALLILHYGGDPGSVTEIAQLARNRGLSLVEDAACSLGSFSDGKAAGTFGDVGVWSFDAAKLLTTGDGGMIWCRSEELASKLRQSIRLGVGTSGLQRRSLSSRWWEIDPLMLGRRATMNDVAAAIGLAQLGRLPLFLQRRREIAVAYNRGLAGLPGVTLPERAPSSGALFYYWIQVAPEHRDRLAGHLLDEDIYTNFRYWPLHRTTMYRQDRSFPGADRAAATTLLLPVHQGLSDTDVASVIAAVRAYSFDTC